MKKKKILGGTKPKNRSEAIDETEFRGKENSHDSKKKFMKGRQGDGWLGGVEVNKQCQELISNAGGVKDKQVGRLGLNNRMALQEGGEKCETPDLIKKKRKKELLMMGRNSQT